MRTHRVAAAIFIFFSLIMFSASFLVEQHSFVKGLSARFWPQLVTILLCCLAMALFCQAKDTGDTPDFPWSNFVTCLVYFLGYVLGLEVLGYVLATFLFQMLFLRHMRIRTLSGSILFPMASTFALVAGFKWGLDVLLPTGVWYFRTLNSLSWA